MSGASRTRIIALTVATAGVLSGLGISSASAKPDPHLMPNVPGVGDSGGLLGPGPQITVYGGAVKLRGGHTVQIEVECLTSTQMGCSGDLGLDDAAGRRVASAEFDLDEDQSEGVFLTLPADAKRRAARRKGWKLTAVASGVDSLGRSTTETTGVRVRARRKLKSD